MARRVSIYLFRAIRQILRRLAATALLLTVMAHSAAADLSTPEGFWQPLDSAGNALGLVQIYQYHGAYFGRIEPSSPTDDRSSKCVRCTDERKDRPIIGLVLIRNMRPQGDEYGGGDILDPDTGRLYGCKFRLIEGGQKMIMRGYFGISLLGRSQIWRRVPDPH
jgi:uncharacterized protein (DUF2147 family)